MEKGLLGALPQPMPVQDSNKRKREALCQYIASMMQGNPKMLLADSPLFEGVSQHQLPFDVTAPGMVSEFKYQARIRLHLPDGVEAWGIGNAQTKKEAERAAAIDSCKKLNEMGLLVGASKSSSNSGWGDNPKIILATSVAFRDICRRGKAGALPILLRSSGPDHAKVFVAELAVPIQKKGEVYMAVGQGSNKAEAERVCCTVACEKLYEEELLNKPYGEGGPLGNSNVSFIKALQAQQNNKQPSIITLRDKETMMIEDALQQLHLECQNTAQTSCKMETASLGYEATQKEIPEIDSGTVSRERVATKNAILCLEARKRMFSLELAEQRQARQSLPSWVEKQKIVDMIYSNRVVVLSGETGCGKTTQVPQFILEEAELQGMGAEVNIVVTQPRRIAATSVAERVAWERGESIGRSVGYAIRLESVQPRSGGSILYCTTGILLRRLQESDGLAGVTHVIVDEVHERDLETDFLLIILRELIQHHPPLRVVIMSATLDASIFTRYFGGCPMVSIPGMIHPVQVMFLEDLSKLMSQYSLPVTSDPRPGLSDDEDIDVDLVASVLSWVDQEFAKDDGAILCFLPGWDNIAIVRDRLLKMPASKSMMIVPLHSHVPAAEQRVAFTRAPAGMRKIVLSTNIAETSVTIDDVVYVVDTGKVKENQFDPSRNLTIMHLQWTSQASARQRMGRAGRVRDGFCFRLYTQQAYTSMLKHQLPEMQRVPLEELCLQIKAVATPSAVADDSLSGNLQKYTNDLKMVNSAMSDIATFLSRALQPPKGPAVHAAIKVLQDLGAIDQYQNLTPLGKTLAKLAVHPRFGKMLVYGALLGCLDPLLTMAAAACSRDPFVSPVNKRDEAHQMHESIAVGAAYGSDHLTLVNAFEKWLEANSIGQGYSFCENFFLAPSSMKLIAGMRKQFERTLFEAGIVEPSIRVSNKASTHLARCLLVAGLYPNIAQSGICKESKGTKKVTKQAFRWRLGFKVQKARVLIHPTSVVSGKHLNPEAHYYLVFQQKLQTSQVFVRGCTLLPPLAVVLLGWNVCVSADPAPTQMGEDWMILELEGWLKFLIERRAGVLLLQLRGAFETVLTKWVSNSTRTNVERYVVDVVVSLLEAACHDMFLIGN